MMCGMIAEPDVGENALDFDPDTIGPGAFPVRFGRYELNGLLGDGGTARVFRAHLLGPANFRKPMALKIVRGANRPEGRTRTLIFDEARIGGRLVHPNLVETYDVGERAGRLFVAMQLVDGLTLRQLMREVDVLPPRAILELARQVVDGLAHAHALLVDGRSAQLVHRDLKPANVLVGRDGVARIADFGIARAMGLTDAAPEGSIWGTLGYMSPEQAFGRGATQASDVFAAGIMLAEMATGKRFAPVKELATYVQALKELGATLPGVAEVVDGVIPGLGAIAARCMRVQPAERFPNGRALAAAIAELAVPAGRGLASVMQQVLGDEAEQEVQGEGPVGGGSGPPAAPHVSPEAALDESIATIVTSQAVPVSAVMMAMPSDPFVGREALRRRLTDGLHGADRLVTLIGLPGIGKSRLALQVAQDLRGAMAGGVVVCDLSDVTSTDGLLSAVAGGLGVPAAFGEASDAFAHRLGLSVAERGPLLLVLDGLDRVLAPAAMTLPLWLQRAPDLRILATAMERLRLDRWECVERVAALSPEDARALFLTRAGGTLANRASDPAVSAELDAVVARLDGLPLALELAAAHAHQLSGDGMFAANVSHLLDTPSRRKGPRSTVRAALDWSIGLLSPWQRSALAQLSIFLGGFTLDAAQGVLDLTAHSDVPFTFYVLESLLERSLLQMLPAADPVDGTTPEQRFALPPLVHAHLEEPAVGGSMGGGDELDFAAERANALIRHAQYFARFGQPAHLLALDTQGGAARRAELVFDQENLAAAVRGAVNRRDAEVAAGAALALLETAGGTGRLSTPDVAAVAATALSQAVPARLYHWLALRLFLLQQGSAEPHAAARFAGELLLAADTLGDDALALEALDLTAAVALTATPLQAGLARSATDEADVRSQALQDRRGLAQALARRAALQTMLGQPGEAIPALTAALQLHHEAGNRRGEARALVEIGRAFLGAGKLAEAARALKRAVVVAREAALPSAEAGALHVLAELSLHMGRLEDAARLAERAVTLMGETDATPQACLSRGLLAEVRALFGSQDEARALLETTIELADRLGHAATQGALRGILASVTALSGDTSTARYLLKAAESFLRDAGDPVEYARMLLRRGDIECAAANLVGAWTALHEARNRIALLYAPPDSPLGVSLARLDRELTET